MHVRVADEAYPIGPSARLSSSKAPVTSSSGVTPLMKWPMALMRSVLKPPDLPSRPSSDMLQLKPASAPAGHTAQSLGTTSPSECASTPRSCHPTWAAVRWVWWWTMCSSVSFGPRVRSRGL